MRPLPTVKIETVDCENLDDSDDPLTLVACRVCLATDVKLFDLHVNKLAQSFGDLTGTPVMPTDGLPQHICVTCRALVIKSAAFRAKCRASHVFLQDLRVHNPVIRTSTIRHLGPLPFRPLVQTKILSLDYEPTDQDIEPRFIEPRFIEDGVKHEDAFGVSGNNAIRSEEIDSLQDLTDDLNTELVVDFLDNADYYFDDVKDVKEEKPPVKWTRKKKEKKKKEKDKVKGKKAKELTLVKQLKHVKEEPIKLELEFETDLDGDLDTDADGDFEVTPKRQKKPPKRKRPYNRKFEEDFVGFSKQHNFDVEFLSHEQQMADVEARKDSIAYKNARLRCESCYRGFMTERAFQKHVVWHDPATGSHACDVCRQYYPTRDKLLSHLRKHRMHFKCRQCGSVFRDSTKAKQHHKWHEGIKYECKHCGRNFNAKSTQINHVRENHTPCSCDICGETILGTIELSRHKTSHTKVVNCPTCSMEFHSEEALHRHIAGNNNCANNPAIKACSLCGEGFSNLEKLRRHMDDQHKGPTHRCEDCGATFVSDRSLSIHWKRVHGASDRPPPGAAPRRYMCEVCAHSYANEVQLKYHQRVHTGERPHACPMCPKRFRMYTNLRVHINTHTGERPYKCKLCPETFKSYSQRHKHKLLVHTKERRHKCSMCDKTYVVSFDLKEHIRFAHMKIPRPPRNRRRKKPEQLQPLPLNINMPLNSLAALQSNIVSSNLNSAPMPS